MNITTAQVKKIRLEPAKLKPAKITLDGNRSLTVKEAVFALAGDIHPCFDTPCPSEKISAKITKSETMSCYTAPQDVWTAAPGGIAEGRAVRLEDEKRT